jgi:hypothetical protein
VISALAFETSQHLKNTSSEGSSAMMAGPDFVETTLQNGKIST